MQVQSTQPKRQRRPRTRWGDREARIADILDAAKELLRESGAQGFNMRDIAERARVSLGVPYWYFESKEEIFVHVYCACTEELGKKIDALCEQAKAPVELFREIVDAYRVFYRDYGRHLNTMAFAGDPKALAELPKDVIDRMRNEQARIVLTVSARLAELNPKAAQAVEQDPLRLPFMWIVVSGLADFFIGPRATALPFGWSEMVDYAARILVIEPAQRLS